MLTPRETEKLINDIVRQVNGIVDGLVKRIEALEEKAKEPEPKKPGRPRKVEKEAA